MRRAQQLGDRKAAGELWQDSHDLIFTTKYGTPTEPGTSPARSPCAPIAPASGSSRSGNTRHTCSSPLVALKVHPKVAQRILRHSQIAMTTGVYAEASEAAVRYAPRSASCPTPWGAGDPASRLRALRGLS
jgi:hypothetical protein